MNTELLNGPRRVQPLTQQSKLPLNAAGQQALRQQLLLASQKGLTHLAFTWEGQTRRFSLLNKPS